MENTKKRAIVTGGQKEHFPAMATLALNLKSVCPKIADELVIFHDGIPETEQKKLKELFPTRFILYRSPFDPAKDGFTKAVWHHFSLMLFCKYECWRLLEEYRTVIWTDYDIVILRDISEITEHQNSPCKFITGRHLIKKFNGEIYKQIDDYRDIDFIFGEQICAGLYTLFDDFPDYLDFYRECIELTRKLAPALTCAEEGVISLLFQRKGISPEHLDAITYCTNPKTEPVTEKAKILHTGGSLKFWNGFYNEDWQRYYREWTEQYQGSRMKRDSFSFKEKVRDILPYGLVMKLLG